MGIIRKDLSTNSVRMPFVRPASVRGFIHSSAQALIDRFGEPGNPHPRTIGAWVVHSPAGPMRLSQAPGRRIYRGLFTVRRWQIEALTDHGLPWIFKVVTGSTAGFPTAVLGAAEEPSIERLARAYVDFAYRHHATVASRSSRRQLHDVVVALRLSVDRGEAGLPFAIRELADSYRLRREVFAAGGTLDMALYDEIEATLRALASMPATGGEDA